MSDHRETRNVDPSIEKGLDDRQEQFSYFTTLHRFNRKIGRDEAFGLTGVIPPTRTAIGDVKKIIDRIRETLREVPGLAEEIQHYRDEQRRKEQDEIDARRRNQFHS